MSEKRRFEVQREFDYRPVPVLLHGSQSLLARSREEPIGALWKRMGALLLAAFTVEGFINTVGPMLFKDRWKDSDRARGLEWKSWDFKLKQIAKVGGISINLASGRGLQSRMSSRHGITWRIRSLVRTIWRLA